jgi:diadenosine tetraphosphate (Ap4A) HIT family hydrolase
MVKFPEPLEGTVFYEDDRSYACLAFHPIAEGHTIVAWKDDFEDLNDMNVADYDHLMRVVFVVRDALMRCYNAPKVYVAYLDEFRHVHFHLFPRKEGDEMGFGFMNKPHGELAGTNFAPTVETLKYLLKYLMEV